MVDINYGNSASHVAISTLWTDRKRIAMKIDKKQYSIIGNLYSSHGVNYLLQTLLKNTHITTLILFGYSLTKSDEDLLKLWKEGVKEGKIAGTKVSLQLNVKEVDLVRNNVKLIDLRKKSIEELQQALEAAHKEANKEKRKQYAEPREVPFFEEERIETLPSPLTGHVIYENSIFAAWVKLLNYVMKFGELKRTEYEEDQKEYNNVMVTIGKHIEVVEMGFSERFSSEELEQYYQQQILHGIKPEELGISYSYGDRLFNYKGINQIEFIVDKLGKTPSTRRAVAMLWKPEIDQDDEHGPCLNLVSCNIHHNEVYMSVVFRSNDVFNAWYKNVLGLMKLQKYITEKINGKFGTSYLIGKFTINCISAHIYKRDFSEALDIVEKNLRFINRLLIDPKGMFVIVLKEGQIIVEYRSNDGELIEKFHGKDGVELYKRISNNDIFSFFVHSAYLGYQISKAEHCLKLNLPYVQDKAPDYDQEVEQEIKGSKSIVQNAES